MDISYVFDGDVYVPLMHHDTPLWFPFLKLLSFGQMKWRGVQGGLFCWISITEQLQVCQALFKLWCGPWVYHNEEEMTLPQ